MKWRNRALPSVPENAIHLPPPERLPLVVGLLALGERQFELGDAPVVEEQLERHQRHALALNGADQMRNLAGMQQELARPGRQVAVARGLDVGEGHGQRRRRHDCESGTRPAPRSAPVIMMIDNAN